MDSTTEDFARLFLEDITQQLSSSLTIKSYSFTDGDGYRAKNVEIEIDGTRKSIDIRLYEPKGE